MLSSVDRIPDQTKNKENIPGMNLAAKKVDQNVNVKALQVLGTEHGPIRASATIPPPKQCCFIKSGQTFGKSEFPVFEDDAACVIGSSDEKSKDKETLYNQISKNAPAIDGYKCSMGHLSKNASIILEPIIENMKKRGHDPLSLDLIYNITYMSELMEFQYEKSEGNKLSEKFLKNYISGEERAAVIKFLIQLHLSHKYPSFILYQAVKIFDTYIDKCDLVESGELQMMGLAALWIASKRELLNHEVPRATDILTSTSHQTETDKKLLFKCEKRILSVLRFEVSFADPFSLLALITLLLSDFDENQDYKLLDEIYYFGSYIIDVSLIDGKFCNLSVITLAALSAEVAFTLYEAKDDNFFNLRWLHWRDLINSVDPIIQNTRLSDKKMDEIRDQMLQDIYFSRVKEKDSHVVFKKYSTSRFGAVSKKIVGRVVKLFSIDEKSELEMAKNYLCKEMRDFEMYSEKDYKKLVRKPFIEICENFVRASKMLRLNFQQEKEKLLREKQEADVQVEKLQTNLMNAERRNEELESQFLKRNEEMDSEIEKINHRECQKANEIDDLKEKLTRVSQRVRVLEIENETLSKEVQISERSRKQQDENIIAQNLKIQNLESKIADIKSFEKQKFSLNTTSSTYVKNHMRLNVTMKERDCLKNLCKTQAQRIKELEQQIQELSTNTNGVT